MGAEVTAVVQSRNAELLFSLVAAARRLRRCQNREREMAENAERTFGTIHVAFSVVQITMLLVAMNALSRDETEFDVIIDASQIVAPRAGPERWMKYTRVQTVMERLKAKYPSALLSHISRGSVETAEEDSKTGPVMKKSRKLLGFLSESWEYCE
eukprot:767485-Hanusia_phi.AAC.4